MKTDHSSGREREAGGAVSLVCSLITVYRNTLSHMLPASCRFYPSCSEYAEMSLKKHGLVRGSMKTVGRILRCAPWKEGGVDYP